MGLQGASVLSEFPPRDIVKVSYTSSVRSQYTSSCGSDMGFQGASVLSEFWSRDINNSSSVV
jgi:hypothetical protein